MKRGVRRFGGLGLGGRRQPQRKRPRLITVCQQADPAQFQCAQADMPAQQAAQ